MYMYTHILLYICILCICIDGDMQGYQGLGFRAAVTSVSMVSMTSNTILSILDATSP